MRNPDDFFKDLGGLLTDRKEESARNFQLKVLKRNFPWICRTSPPEPVWSDGTLREPLREYAQLTQDRVLECLDITKAQLELEDLFKFDSKGEAQLDRFREMLRGSKGLAAVIFPITRNGLWVLHNFGDSHEPGMGRRSFHVAWWLDSMEVKIQPLSSWLEENNIKEG